MKNKNSKLIITIVVSVIIILGACIFNYIKVKQVKNINQDIQYKLNGLQNDILEKAEWGVGREPSLEFSLNSLRTRVDNNKDNVDLILDTFFVYDYFADFPIYHSSPDRILKSEAMSFPVYEYANEDSNYWGCNDESEEGCICKIQQELYTTPENYKRFKSIIDDMTNCFHPGLTPYPSPYEY